MSFEGRWALILIATAPLACSSSSAAQSTSTSETSTCATYSAPKPTIVAGAQLSGTYPDCTPRCGESRVGDFGGSNYLESALPAGTCASAPSCRMVAWGSCPDGNTDGHGPANGYRCDCVAGQWTCTLESPGGGAGTCPVAPDAGSDG